ncbi:response regulator [Chamaesiphon minutus]|uniref:Diguanylate cyclase (GGDEF) domain-containing protein n=1 Tax=Chamaesiphon minutus (strain ATCC 27169 / PCC 6605) TaxID=1173020 RepID=K9UQG4_CHAP6|nr:response regulator [Chamaesiphon minutus]AFY96923.1 diguanylate cyclase (GGDEF) domain-containing protein [Chamaesiphon minutus PCC 6605]
MKILVVEDDEAIAEMLVCMLTTKNYTVEVANDGEAAWELIVVYEYDLLLIDITLPRLDGISLCRRVREHGYQMQIMLLTGRGSSHDQAIGLDAGADAYMTKPPDREELIARIRALLRRGGTTFDSVLKWGNLQLDPATREVTYAEQPLFLSPKEFAILEFFVRNGRRVFTYSTILDRLWAYEETPSEDAVRTHIKGIRQKLRRAGAPTNAIETVYGLGYRLKPLESVTDSIDPNRSATQPIQQQIHNALSEQQEIDRAADDLTIEQIDRQEPLFTDERPLLLIIDPDRQLAEQLMNEAVNWGFRSAISTTLAAAETKIDRDPPTVVLLDPDITHPTTDSLKLLAKLTHQTPAVPVLVFTSHDRLTDRLEVAQLGGHSFLRKPSPLAQVLKAVAQAAQQAEAAKQRVMIVDNDPQILANLQGLLEPWGLSVTTLDDPQQFWETLESCSPDLLILEMNMPILSGVDLCQIVRNDSRWGSLPIIFLTTNPNIETIDRVYSVGADDFVSKPIAGSELVSRVINRLDRIELLRNAAEIDRLTKLSNRHKSTQDLDKYLQLAARQNLPLCLAVLDLDNLKAINERHGYSTGDMVMRQWGQLLRQTFRQNTVIARWEGDEFVVALFDTIEAEGIQRLTQLLATLQRRQFVAPDRTQFRIAFSAGIAQYPDDGTDLPTLYQAAAAALHQSKVAGCACISAAGDTQTINRPTES